ncbi:YraN family protein [Parahaliea mediterranea]|uniref:YraN family protein n=1 Tax=Parahaliea mediterranea TaxID=651086 RepID=UPI0014760D3B|nr:YraN family protein [Parahaliea mediterranea]
MNPANDPHEELAAAFLQQQGLQLIGRNIRFRGGELDIVALDGNTLVFVEVRARRNPRFASAAASVDWRKQRKLQLAASLFLRSQPRWRNYPCRFDVIAFEPRQSSPAPEPQWIRSAFTA